MTQAWGLSIDGGNIERSSQFKKWIVVSSLSLSLFGDRERRVHTSQVLSIQGKLEMPLKTSNGNIK